MLDCDDTSSFLLQPKVARFTSFGSTGIQIERQPSCAELILLVRMLLLVCFDGLVQLLFTHITPRANGITNNFDVEFRHFAEGGPEHQGTEARKM